jgi:hypothetical protein
MAVSTETTEVFDATSLLGVLLDAGIISIPTDLISGAAWKVDQTTYTVTPICETHAPFSPTAPSAAAWTNSAPPIVVPAVAPATNGNPIVSADAQLRRAETEFRAGRMSLEEFRQIKKVLQPTP